jgi:hypothetical protein
MLSKNIQIRIYKTIFLSMVLYVCEIWPVTLGVEDGLRVFENRMLRRIFGLKRDVVMGGWRKRHYDELHNLYSSPSIIRMIKPKRVRWGHVTLMTEKRNAYGILVKARRKGTTRIT